MNVREALAAKLQTAFGDGFAVYPSGVDIIKTPAVVVNPGDPYQVPTTMGVDQSIQTFLGVWLITNRISPTDALTHLEEMRQIGTKAIMENAPAGRWTSFGRLGSTTVSGEQYATGIIEAVFVSTDDN